ncbi:MAG: threonine/serine exporter family protein [Coriobacteriales bacterium]|jgi:uncharacterized membrane protein YjjP (DUF1212 family)
MPQEEPSSPLTVPTQAAGAPVAGRAHPGGGDDGFPADESDVKVVDASLRAKSAVIMRAGLLMLSSGTGASRVRELMDRVAESLGVRCRADVDLVDIDLTVTDGAELFTEIASLPSTGVNTERMQLMNGFVDQLSRYRAGLTVGEVFGLLDEIERHPGNYHPWQHGLASGCACGAFVFLLGGGPVEMLCAALGAGFGNFSRRRMSTIKLNHFAAMILSVIVGGLVYLASLSLLGALVPGVDASVHQAGYIGALLFVIPGFPLITGGLDIARFNFASGIQRLTYAFAVIILACFTGWIVAIAVGFYPSEFEPQGLSAQLTCALRLVMSFVGVFGFSVMFNSTQRMCLAAALIGMVSNTCRLELIDLASMPPELAALVGATISGLLASVVGLRFTMPRISLTVPSIVIMVPGLYLYRAMYFLGEFNAVDGLSWALRAIIIILCLPLGLCIARVLTDPSWRYDGGRRRA